MYTHSWVSMSHCQWNKYCNLFKKSTSSTFARSLFEQIIFHNNTLSSYLFGSREKKGGWRDGISIHTRPDCYGMRWEGIERTSLFTLLSSARTWSNPDIGARKIIASTKRRVLVTNVNPINRYKQTYHLRRKVSMLLNQQKCNQKTREKTRKKMVSKKKGKGKGNK